MKVLTESPVVTIDLANPPMLTLQFPAGIVGLPQHRRGELFHLPDQLPFQWLRLHGPDLLHFVVIDPNGFVADYQPELFDDDAAAIGITSGEDALLLNIVTLRGNDLSAATVNLVGPVVVNRHTGVARQVVIANHSRFSAHHPLVSAS